MMSEEGKDITLYRLHKGDLCMLSASCVLEAVTFDVFVDAENDSECCVVSGPAFAAVSERNPDIRIFALETAVARFSDVMWVMQQILFMSMDRRLAIFLSDELARTGSDTISMTHGQIARYMGSAREVVSRMQSTGLSLLSYCFCDAVTFLALHISCVMVPIGQYTHQERGLKRTMVRNPSTVEVSMTL